MKITFVAAVNNDQILQQNLLASAALQSGVEFLPMRGYASAAAAFNEALVRAQGDYVIFVHQDVYLAPDWLTRFTMAVNELNLHDANWGVIGMWGINTTGGGEGYIYCTAGGHLLGGPFAGCRPVRTLDEVMLVVRRNSGLRFDEQIGGYHMYGTDLCLLAESRGMKNYAFAAFGIHNSNGYGMLPRAFWRAFFAVRAKWTHALPVLAPCGVLSKWCVPVIRWNVVQGLNLLFGRHKVGKRLADPVKLTAELAASGVIPKQFEPTAPAHCPA